MNRNRGLLIEDGEKPSVGEEIILKGISNISTEMEHVKRRVRRLEGVHTQPVSQNLTEYSRAASKLEHKDTTPDIRTPTDENIFMENHTSRVTHFPPKFTIPEKE